MEKPVIGDDLAPLYADFAFAVTLGLVTFSGILSSVDEMAFDAVPNTSHKLRYRDSQTLAPGNSLTIAGATYKVVGQPKRISEHEFTAALARQP